MAGAVVLVMAGAVLLFAGNVMLWVDGTLLDSDEFSQSVEGTLQNDDVQDRFGRGLARFVIERGDLESRLEGELPPRLQFAAPLLSVELEPLIAQVVERLLDSGAVERVTQQAIRDFHAGLLALLRDEDRQISVADGELVLDLNPLLDRLFQRVGVTPPESLGDAGHIVILDDTSGLAQASFFVKNSGTLTLLGLLGALLCFAAAIALFARVRLGLRAGGIAALAVGLLTLLTLFAINEVLESISGDRVIARELLRDLESGLRWQSMGLVLAGGCLIAASDARLFDRLQSAGRDGWAAIGSAGAGRVLAVVAGVAALLLFLAG